LGDLFELGHKPKSLISVCDVHKLDANFVRVDLFKPFLNLAKCPLSLLS